MLRLFPPGVRNNRTWKVRGRLDGRGQVELVTGCDTEEMALVWRDAFLRRLARVPIGREKPATVASAARAANDAVKAMVFRRDASAADHRQAGRVSEALSQLIVTLNHSDFDRVRRGCNDLQSVASKLAAARQLLDELSGALQI
jgi:hypothetical protein